MTDKSMCEHTSIIKKRERVIFKRSLSSSLQLGEKGCQIMLYHRVPLCKYYEKSLELKQKQNLFRGIQQELFLASEYTDAAKLM